MTTFYLVRHGETDYNKRSIVQGRRINSNLNETGLLQARSLADRLRLEPLDAIYSSTLERARQTAAIVAEEHPETPFFVERDFEEMSWGIFEGAEMSEETAAAFEDMNRRWMRGEYAFSVEEGESILEVQERAVRVLERLRHRHDGETVLVVTHGRLLRVLLASILEEYSLKRMHEIHHSNTAVNLIHWDGRRYHAELLNCTQHLLEDASILIE